MPTPFAAASHSSLPAATVSYLLPFPPFLLLPFLPDAFALTQNIMPTGNALLSTQSFNGAVGGRSYPATRLPSYPATRLTVCPAPGACLAKVPQMRVTMMITLIHIHDYIYLYTYTIHSCYKKLKEPIKM